MRKFFAIATIALLTVVLLPAAMAQAPNPAPAVYAEDFNNWTFVSSAANTFTFPGANCWVTPLERGVPSYFVFGNPNTGINYPVAIRDSNGLFSEVVTPSSISTAQSACGFNAATVYAHASFFVQSGTAGLQDAVAAMGSSAASAPLNVIYLDKYWYGLVAGLPQTPAVQTVPAIIAALKGGSGIELVDITSIPWTYYAWNGTSFSVAAGNTGGNQSGVVAAVTAGAGTAATISTTGSAGSQIVNLTTGTGATTGNVFTLAYSRLTGGVVSGTYTSGLTVVGSIGQQICLTATNNGSTATALLRLTGANTIAGATAFTVIVPGTAATAAPTTASAAITGCGITNPATSVSGTATISTVLGSSGGFTYPPSCTIVSIGSVTPTVALTVSSTYSSPTATVTAAVATTALTSSTAGYAWRVSCQ